MRNREAGDSGRAVVFNRLHRSLERSRYGDSEVKPIRVSPPYAELTQREREHMIMESEIHGNQTICGANERVRQVAWRFGTMGFWGDLQD